MTRRLVPQIFVISTFCLLFSAVNADAVSSIQVWSTDKENRTYTIVSQKGLAEGWNAMDKECGACSGPATAIQGSSTDKTPISIRNSGDKPINIADINLKSKNDQFLSLQKDASSFVIAPDEVKTFTITYDCNNNTILKNDLKGWTFVEVSLMVDDSPLKFNYMKICTTENKQRSSDYSLHVLLLIAILVVAFQTRQKTTLLAEQGQDVDEIKPLHAVFFIVFASISLLTLYFFSQYIKGLLAVIFVLYSLTGCTIIFTTWTERFFKNSAFWSRHYQIPCIGAVNLHMILCFIIASSIVGSWYVTRNWILNNFIGLSFVSLIFRVVKLPSLKVAYLLLGLAFFYDIFWVFLSKPIFGESVMVVAATALDLPIKIEWPYFGDTPLPRCSLLGLGDMVLPGFFVTFSYRFGLYKRTNSYYWASVIGYSLGMILCGAVLQITKHGQPALLYIVPCLLGAVTIVCLIRKEFGSMWEGIPEAREYMEMSRDLESHAIQMKESTSNKKSENE